jgi:CheY-like chemotaxis protein
MGAHEHPTSPAGPTGSAGPRTILIVDDSPTIRKIVALCLGGRALRVESAASGAEALERLAETRPDLVLADVAMPEPAGYELCRRIKSSSRPVPVLLLTGAFEPFDAARAVACGADGHLDKPFDEDALVGRVHGLLEAAPRATVAPEATAPAVAHREPEERRESPGADDGDAAARAALAGLTERVVREMVRDMLPAIAERVVRERIRELERAEAPARTEGKGTE